MIRVCTFTMDNISQKFGVMSTAQAEAFIAQVNEARKNGQAEGEPWANHKRQTIADAINRASSNGDGNWNVDKVREEFDLMAVEEFYGQIREKSGIVTASGEAPAA